MKTATTRADAKCDKQGEVAGRDATISLNMDKIATTKDIEYCSRTGRHIHDVPAKEPRNWSRYGDNQEWSKPKLRKSDYSKPSGPRMPAATITTAPHMDKPPRPPAFDAISGLHCFQCNEYGHIAKLCPIKLCLIAKVHLRDLE